MSLNLSLLRIIPLVTLMSGVLLPTNIAKAASSAPTNEASIKQETIKGEEQTGEAHGAEEVHEAGEVHGAGEAHGSGEAHGDGAAHGSEEAHGDGEHHGTGGIPQILFSKKAQQIEFVAFLALIGGSIVLPELLHKPKQRAKQNGQLLKNHKIKGNQKQRIDQVKGNIPASKVMAENAQRLNLVSENLEKFNNPEKNQLNSQNGQERKAS